MNRLTGISRDGVKIQEVHFPFSILLAQKSLSDLYFPDVLSSPVTITTSPLSIPSILTGGFCAI